MKKAEWPDAGGWRAQLAGLPRIPDVAIVFTALIVTGYFARHAIIEYIFGLIFGALGLWIWLVSREEQT